MTKRTASRRAKGQAVLFFPTQTYTALFWLDD
jgi:hypothetical protein